MQVPGGVPILNSAPVAQVVPPITIQGPDGQSFLLPTVAVTAIADHIVRAIADEVVSRLAIRFTVALDPREGLEVEEGEVVTCGTP